MNAFFESLQKELGKGVAQFLLAGLTLLFFLAAGLVQGDTHKAKVLLLYFSAGILLVLLLWSLALRFLNRHHSSAEDIERAHKQGRPICHCTPTGEIMLRVSSSESKQPFPIYRCPKCGSQQVPKGTIIRSESRSMYDKKPHGLW